jgi:hypothetical protein
MRPNPHNQRYSQLAFHLPDPEPPTPPLDVLGMPPDDAWRAGYEAGYLFGFEGGFSDVVFAVTTVADALRRAGHA